VVYSIFFAIKTATHIKQRQFKTQAPIQGENLSKSAIGHLSPGRRKRSAFLELPKVSVNNLPKESCPVAGLA